jgi:hypothetical protein
VPLGDAAVIKLGGIEIALISNRTQALGADPFTGLGIELERRCRLSSLVKSWQPILDRHRHVRAGPIYPGSGKSFGCGLASRRF